MLEVYLAVLMLLNAGLQQAPKKDDLSIIAIVNAILWVGVFLFMLWHLNRRSKRVEDRISRLKSSFPDDDKAPTK